MATNEEVDAAWNELYESGNDPNNRSECFRLGFLAGRKLPEVKAEELLGGRVYIAKWDDEGNNWSPLKVIDWGNGHRSAWLFGDESDVSLSDYTAFLGPLPLEDWGA